MCVCDGCSLAVGVCYRCVFDVEWFGGWSCERRGLMMKVKINCYIG